MDAEAETEVGRPSLAELRADIGDEAFVNWCLETAYNATGIKRWWQRPRTQLGGLSPQEVWNDPQHDRAKVIELAEWLLRPSTA